MKKQRIKILSKAEINELYNVPRFSSNEQETYFSLDKKAYKLMSKRGSLASKVHFILQLGFFNATSQFFNCTFKEVKRDVDFILQKYFENSKLESDSISKQTRHTNQTLIAKIIKFQTDKSTIQKRLKKILGTRTRLSNNPVYLFHEVLCYSAQNKLMLLGYSTIQELIGHAILCEERRLGESLEKHLSHEAWSFIENTLRKDEDKYVLTALKKDPKSFKSKEIKAEIKKLTDHEILYKISKKVLPKLNLSDENIYYYASLAEHYPISNLKKLSSMKKAIYILCYAYHRHKKINDNLTVSFLHYLEKFKTESTNNARDKIFDDKLEVNNDTKNAALVFRFFDDEKISDKESFGSIRKKARKYVRKGKFNRIADYLMGLLFDFQEIKWKEIAKIKKKITVNLRPIFNALTFSGDSNQQHLLLAILFLKKYFSSSSNNRKTSLKNAPIKCIPNNWKQYLMKDGTVDIEKYEFMIYQLISEKIEAGHIYLQDSISFKSLSSHLVSDREWRNKSALLKRLGNKKLLMPIDHLLNDLESTLEKLITDVNKRIDNGENKEIKIKKEGDEITFTLPYPDRGTACIRAKCSILCVYFAQKTANL